MRRLCTGGAPTACSSAMHVVKAGYVIIIGKRSGWTRTDLPMYRHVASMLVVHSNSSKWLIYIYVYIYIYIYIYIATATWLDTGRWTCR
jgi:hypothetical protein